MVHIILLILKTIGIIILFILGLLLAMLLVCLFVPVIYRIRGTKQGLDMHGVGSVHWLLVSVKASIDSQDKKVKVKIRILGIPLAVFQKIGSVLGKGCQGVMKAVNKVISIFRREAQATINKNTATAKENTNEMVKPVEVKEVTKIEAVTKQSEGEETAKIEVVAMQDKATEENTAQADDKDLAQDENFRAGLWSKIKVFIIKIYYFPQWLYERVRKIYLTIRNFCGKIKRWKEFFTSDTFKKALHFVLNKGGAVLKHILPRKIKGNVTYGFDDPAITGQSLAVLSMISPIYKGKFKVVPMFDQKILEGDIDIKGHILGFALVRIAWSVYRNKDVKGVIRHFSQKEA